MLSHSNPPTNSAQDNQIKKTHLSCEYLLQSIQRADFSNTDFDGYMSHELKQLLKQHASLKILNLANNRIDQLSILDLTEVLEENSCLTELDLTNNQIGSDGVTYLFKAICDNPKTALRKLNLSYNCIDSIETNILKNFLKKNQSLETLILNQNALNTPSKNGNTLPLLFESLANNQTLIYLSLQNTKLLNTHINALIHGLKNNTSLQMLNLSHSILELNHQQIIYLLLSLNDKKNFTLNFGPISDALASLIVQTVPNKHLKIIAQCNDSTLTKKLSAYQEPSITQFSCINIKNFQENNAIEEYLNSEPFISVKKW